MVSKLDKQTFTGEFESHWVPHSYGLVSHLNKSLVNYYLHELFNARVSGGAIYPIVGGIKGLIHIPRLVTRT